ncbi:MAG: M20/M25/M40 family metallo-hydrolase [Flavobacteriaceae bacterium]|nr:M20/M25/M40 family metallo-hydrolase [Flavobacteriaceae bacterium]
MTVAQTKLSKKEKKLMQAVAANNAEALALLTKVVNINSGSMNHKGVKAVADVFDTEFKAIGFKTKWIDMSEVNRAGHFFAETQPKKVKGKKLLLIGHLDTVFEENSPFQQWNMVNDSIAHAPGGNDMKGGNVIILYALKALQEQGLLKNAQVIVGFTGDEEHTGNPKSISRRDLVEAGKRSDIALGFEPAANMNEATIGRRGISGWTVETTGERAHSSLVFSEEIGAGAIFEMSRILHQFYTDVRDKATLTFNPGALLGGTLMEYDAPNNKGNVFGKTNVVAQTAVVDGGLRFISEEEKETAREKMREIVANNLPNTSAKISFKDSYPAMAPTNGNERLLDKLSQVNQALGLGPVVASNPVKKGAADVSFVAAYCDAMDSLGAYGHHAHTPEETVNINKFELLTQRTAILLYRLLQEQ